MAVRALDTKANQYVLDPAFIVLFVPVYMQYVFVFGGLFVFICLNLFFKLMVFVVVIRSVMKGV